MMRSRVVLFLLSLIVLSAIAPAYALDEGALTPTGGTAIAAEDQEFNAAMAVWFKHKYKDGEKLLREFSKKHPDSRWAAEADLHVGCNLVYQKKYGEARQTFDKLIAKHPTGDIAVKAKVRLGNIADATGDYRQAVRQYSEILEMDCTPAQFRYANYRARLAGMNDVRKQALINCGPVALAACLESLGKTQEAVAARALKPEDQGLSLARLETEAQNLGVKAIAAELTFAQFKAAKLPVLAYLTPNHFAAVLAVEGNKVRMEDSIQGRYETTLAELEKRWSGRVLVFSPSQDVKPLSVAEAQQTLGGCCGHTYESECSGCGAEYDCEQPFDGGSGGGGGGGGGGGWGEGGCSTCGTTLKSGFGSPIWKFNTVTLNVIAQDTPIWYDSGRGPKIAFTLTYSNENSDTGVFGLGWRSPYDARVYFLPPLIPADPPSLQVYRPDGRIETYDSAGNLGYQPRFSTADYGYVDTIQKEQDGTTILNLRSGGKYYFKPEGDAAEGRIWKIEDQIGDQVVCGYEDGVLATVTDANGHVTTIESTGVGVDERVTMVTLPDGRHADFAYTNGDLTSITDMNDSTSTLEYGASYASSVPERWLVDALVADPLSPADGANLQLNSTTGFPFSGAVKVTYQGNSEIIGYSAKFHNQIDVYKLLGIDRGTPAISAPANDSNVSVKLPWSTLGQAVTVDPLVPDDSGTGTLSVASTEGFPSRGLIKVNNSEIMSYAGKTDTTFTGIHRGVPAAASQGAVVQMWRSVPYLSKIITPSGKVMFTYKPGNPQSGGYSQNGPTVHLHEVYECGPQENFPNVPTWHLAWCWGADISDPTYLAVTRYPSSVQSNPSSECDQHWTGGLTKQYHVFTMAPDLSRGIKDESGNTTATYGYGGSGRDRTSVTDGNGKQTTYVYDDYHNVRKRSYVWKLEQGQPVWASWVYEYESEFPYRLLKVGDAITTGTDSNDVQEGSSSVYHRLVNLYVYDTAGKAAGQVQFIKTRDTAGNLVTLTENSYDTAGNLEWTKDGRGMQTTYRYNEGTETRGFLTSVEDPEHNITMYSYDTAGRRYEVTDPNNRVTTYDYDGLDRVTKITYPDDTYSEFHYTCCHMDWKKDENGKQTTYTYDSKNRLYQVTAPDTGVTTYVYDSAILDRVNAVVDAENHATYYQYYANGKLKQITYADGTWEKYDYDGAGNLRRKMDSADKITDYEYDENNRLKMICPL